jgi:hypothetical protein
MVIGVTHVTDQGLQWCSGELATSEGASFDHTATAFQAPSRYPRASKSLLIGRVRLVWLAGGSTNASGLAWVANP